ncbi:MAG: 4Fe-4S dicluster domain-containing protein [Clostridiales Family XIII bacterium]|jgi:anaerobic dimethyl sulfoxide reductase subunit B (iron-sulfur subunit)|nr:4Fe-4S dicluster domain-containing protein [Clostridiales Family XIII bacterium]
MIARFNFHPELCVGCGACVLACLDADDTDLSVRPPLRRLFKEERLRGGRVGLAYYSSACMHCTDAPCADACPAGLFSKDGETGLVLLDNSKCVGCGSCAKACAFDGIRRDVNGKSWKCNGCGDYLELDRPPACVSACPRRAITVDEVNDVLETSRKRFSAKIRPLRDRAARGNKRCI